MITTTRRARQRSPKQLAQVIGDRLAAVVDEAMPDCRIDGRPVESGGIKGAPGPYCAACQKRRQRYMKEHAGKEPPDSVLAVPLERRGVEQVAVIRLTPDEKKMAEDDADERGITVFESLNDLARLPARLWNCRYRLAGLQHLDPNAPMHEILARLVEKGLEVEDAELARQKLPNLVTTGTVHFAARKKRKHA